MDELEEEMTRYLRDVYDRDTTVCDVARHFAEWQKMKDYDRYAHVSLKDIRDAWHKLKETDSDIEKHPAVCFARGADWSKEQSEKKFSDKIAGAYQLGRKDEKEQMLKEAVISEIRHFNGFATLQSVVVPGKYKPVERVKIIIVRED